MQESGGSERFHSVSANSLPYSWQDNQPCADGCESGRALNTNYPRSAHKAMYSFLDSLMN